MRSRAPFLGLGLLFLSAAFVILLLMAGAEIVPAQVAVGILLGCGVTAALACMADGWL